MLTKEKKNLSLKETFTKERVYSKERVNELNKIQMNEPITFAIIEDKYKPTNQEILELATENVSLKKQIDMMDKLANEEEEDIKEAVKGLMKDIENKPNLKYENKLVNEIKNLVKKHFGDFGEVLEPFSDEKRSRKSEEVIKDGI